MAIDHAMEPMLARLARRLPDGRGWCFEPKCDGFRRWRPDRDPEYCSLAQLTSMTGEAIHG